MSRDNIPNLVPARCCYECINCSDHDDHRFVFCDKYYDIVYKTEVCDDWSDIIKDEIES